MSEAGTREFEGLTIPTPGTFVLDPYHNWIGFCPPHDDKPGFAAGLASSLARSSWLLKSSAELTINGASIGTGVPARDDDLRSDHQAACRRQPSPAGTPSPAGPSPPAAP